MQNVNSGEYKCQYQYKDKGTFDEITFQVEVIDPVSKPRVTCKKNVTNITLKCTVDSSEQVNFKWKGPDDFSHVGDSVHITNPEAKDSYFCTATNEFQEKFLEHIKDILQLSGIIEVQRVGQAKDDRASPCNISKSSDDFHALYDDPNVLWAVACRSSRLWGHSNGHYD
ncbi:hypothetical protein HF521_016336 [Silurus meridionalis]|uniref:Ig-like domain-containing protein n=1 Tax=Silurus meridionalis TaxID=175797 RepID=A0A8T0BVJ9_SILME|nr:hypothetical protein HF521_016336 [Silurus meridionalis]